MILPGQITIFKNTVKGGKTGMAVVFGAGGDAVRLIYYENQLKIEFFIDNDPEKTGGQFYGFEIGRASWRERVFGLV